MGGDGDFFNELKEDRNLYFHRFTWRYGTEYQVAIRGINVQNERLQSKEVWKTLTLTDCYSLHPNQSTVCGPRSVTGLKETYQLVDDDTFDINITWSKPDYSPDSYSIEIRDFFVALDANRSVGIYRFDLDGVSAAAFNPTRSDVTSSRFSDRNIVPRREHQAERLTGKGQRHRVSQSTA